MKRFKVKTRFYFKINKLTISIILLSLFVVFWFILLNKEVNPILYNYAELETKKLATLVINKAVSNQVSQEMTLDKLIKTTLNKKGEIMSVDFDPVNVNKALNGVTNTVQLNLKLLEEGKLELIDMPENDSEKIKDKERKKGVIYEIPFGVVFYSPILSDLGPKIPVKTRVVGSVVSNVKTKITNYGINNALLEVFIEVEVSEQVILPFISKRITISQDIPVAIKIIEGTVPEFYGGTMSENSPIVGMPIEK